MSTLQKLLTSHCPSFVWAGDRRPPPPFSLHFPREPGGILCSGYTNFPRCEPLSGCSLVIVGYRHIEDSTSLEDRYACYWCPCKRGWALSSLLCILSSSSSSPPPPLITTNSRYFTLRPVKTRTVLHFYRFISSSGRPLGCWGFCPGRRKLPNFCGALIASCLSAGGTARPDREEVNGSDNQVGRGLGAG